MKGSEFGGDDMSTVMTALLTRAIAFVADCRVHDALGDYPHVGDLQWMLHNSASVLDAANWCFWQNEVGQDVGLGITDDDAITVIVHPHATDPFALKLEIRANGAVESTCSSVCSGTSRPSNFSHSWPGRTFICARRVSTCVGVIRPA